jgi:hypothetical protein
MSQERLERVGVGNFFCVCSFVSLWAFYDCKHYCYWRLMRAVILDFNSYVYISSYLNILHI